MVTFPHAARCGITAALLAPALACGGSDVSGPPPNAVAVSGISPSVLSPGASVTISGTHFNPTAASNTVTIDGVAATVTAATASQLVVTVPALPCTASHAASVSVTTPISSASVTHTVRGATAVDATTGNAIVLTSAQAKCAELPAGTGQLLLSVVNLAPSPTTTAGFRLAGDAPAGTLASVMGAAPLVRSSVATPSGASLALLGQGAPRAEQLHQQMLESNAAVYGRLRGGRLDPTTAASRALRTTSSGRASRAVISALPAVGDRRQFRVAQFSTAVGASSSCNDFVEITARVVYVGSKGIVYEDVNAPLAGQTDSYYRTIGQEFDNAMYVVDSTYFGDPLRTDVDTDGDKHLNMVFTPQITTGLAGFVISCDFFARDTTSNRVSNLGENFYAIVPSVAGSGFSGNTPDAWLRSMRHTIVHEVKHIASFGARLENNATSYDESWLEEGTARHAEEIWERRFVYNVPWKGNTGYRASVYCDVRPSFPECSGAPIGIFNHFASLYDVLSNPGATSVFGRVADGDFGFYASSWSLVRYAIDRYASDEAAFLRAITQAVSTRGMASIGAATGQDPTGVFARWTLALYTDGIVSGSPDLDFPTWNTRDIYSNLNRDFASQSLFLRSFPLSPTPTAAAAFSIEPSGIHGGGFAHFLVPGSTTAGRLIHLTAPGGTADAPVTMRLAVTRVP